MKIFWKVYYYFKKPIGMGKSGQVIRHCRVNGIKYINIRIVK